MVEQYIYSRSDSGFSNARSQTVSLGHGFVALSPGMDDTLKKNVELHCAECPPLSQRDSQGIPLPLLRKTCLKLKGRVLLQKSDWIKDSSRDFHVAHGYVLEREEAKAAGPDGWFAVPFQLGNPNAEIEHGGIQLDSLSTLTEEEPFRPSCLKEAMGRQGLGLGKQTFCQLLLACFDALASSKQVLIACDFNALKEQDLFSALHWIYTCLPYELWAGLGFDSIYTKKSVPGTVHIAFVDKASVQTGSRPTSTYIGNPSIGNSLVSLGSNFLILNDQMIHNDSKETAWYGKNSIYSSWLEQVVDTLWECPAEAQDSVSQALNEAYQDFQRQLDAVPEEQRLDPLLYDVICENSLDHGPQALAEARSKVKITPNERHSRRRSLMKQLTEEVWGKFFKDILSNTEENRKKIFEDICCTHTIPADEADIRMLCAMINGEQDASALWLLGAFMAQEADAPEAKLNTVLSRYRELLPSDVYSQLPGRLFFCELGEEEKKLWENLDVAHDSSAAKRRREAWYQETLPENASIEELPSCIKQALSKLRELSDQQQSVIWQESFQAQCETFSENSLREFADEKLPERLKKLEQELSALPGGAPEEALNQLGTRAYDLLLENPKPSMDSLWLSKALHSTRIDEDTRAVLMLLQEFTSAAQGGVLDIEVWKKCRCKWSKEVRRKVIRLLPKMYLAGVLPKIWIGFVVSFLHQLPEKTRQILLRATSVGGGELLLDMLYYTRNFRHELEDGETDLQAIVRIVSTDEFLNIVMEKDGGRTVFDKCLLSFFRYLEKEDRSALPLNELFRAANCVNQHYNRWTRTENSTMITLAQDR